MLPILVFLALLIIPVRFFWLNRYFLTTAIPQAISIYKEKGKDEKNLDAVLMIVFLLGMAGVAAYAI